MTADEAKNLPRWARPLADPLAKDDGDAFMQQLRHEAKEHFGARAIGDTRDLTYPWKRK
jgi:hypothetical protein